MTKGWTGSIVGPCFCPARGDFVTRTLALAEGIIGASDKQDTGIGGRNVLRLPPGYVIAPGFVDVQVNGGGGVMLNTAPTIATLETIVAAHRRGGSTGLVPTLITDTPEILEALIAIAPQAARIPGVLGLHLEGPFINPEKKGVHRADLMQRPTDADVAKLKQLAMQVRLVVTLAPELFSLAQLRELAAAGVILSAGHTLATYADMRTAADAGLTGVTHLFNAMAPLTARAPGVIGAALDDERLFVGVIADGHHVSDANLRLAVKAKSPARVMLVTDAMATVGAEASSFDLQGARITRTRDPLGDRLTDDYGTLAGAHLTMIEAVRRMTAARAKGLGEALIMASTTPAHFLGLGGAIGQLAPGDRADLVAFQRETFDVFDTWIAGHATPGGNAAHTLGDKA